MIVTVILDVDDATVAGPPPLSFDQIEGDLRYVLEVAFEDRPVLVQQIVQTSLPIGGGDQDPKPLHGPPT